MPARSASEEVNTAEANNMNTTIRWSLLSIVLAAGSVESKENKPLALHPDNPHYFLYLDELQANGLNHTRTFAGTYREIPGSFNITDNTLAPMPNRYACPWA